MRIAIVTGASSGLGQGYCRWIDKKGGVDEIWLIARREKRMKDMAEQLHTPCRILPMDLCEEESLVTLEKLLQEVQPEICILVNAAGFGKIGNYADISRSETDRMIHLNCQALVDVTLLCLPYMSKWSRILEISSIASTQPLPQLNVYAASKAFVNSYARALRWELFPRRIRVTSVCPYWIKDTEFIAISREHTEHPGAVRHFPLTTSVKYVVSQSMLCNTLYLPVATPGIFAPIMRLWNKIAPKELAMLAWEGLRRI